MRLTRTPALLALAGLAVMPLAACGSAASGDAPSHPTAPPLKPAALVKLMLPRTVAKAHLVKIATEPLKDDLADPGTPGKPAFDSLIRRTWLAAGHSVFQLNGPKVAVEVSVNMFRSMADAKRVYRMEVAMTPPHTKSVRMPLPVGASPGSVYYCMQRKNLSACLLAWRQGSTVDSIWFVGTGRTVLPR
ncbi:MAG: hypothetical protein ACTHNU_01020, partial [Gaiellales bacterium]